MSAIFIQYLKTINQAYFQIYQHLIIFVSINKFKNTIWKKERKKKKKPSNKRILVARASFMTFQKRREKKGKRTLHLYDLRTCRQYDLRRTVWHWCLRIQEKNLGLYIKWSSLACLINISHVLNYFFFFLSITIGQL